MTKITAKLKEDAKIWAPDYETDFRKSALKNYLKTNNLTKEAYIRELREEIRNNKRTIYSINNKEANRLAQARWRDKNKKQRFIGNVNVEWRYTFLDSKNLPYTVEKPAMIEIDVETTKNDLMNAVKGEIENERTRKIDGYNMTKQPILFLEVMNYKPNIEKYRKGIKLEEVRMKKSGAATIDGYDTQEWDTNTGRCVFDYIIYRYGNIKGFKELCNYEDLHDLFRDDDETLNLFNVGVNTKEIKRFCTKKKIPMYAINDQENVFDMYQPEVSNKKAPALVYRISNQHFYPISNFNKKNSIVHQHQVESVLFQEPIITPSEKDFDLTKTIKKDDLMKSIQLLLVENKVPSKVKLHNNEIISYWYNEKEYIKNEELDLAKELCENMGIKYTGQGFGTLLFKIVEETIGTIPKSTPNNEVFECLIQAKKDGTHQGFIKEKQDMTDCVGIDIAKSYSYSMFNIPEWMLIDFNDKWELYDDELKLGLYYIETEDTLLFKKSNVYPSSIVKKGIDEGIDLDIVYQLIPSKKTDNIFRTVIDKVIEYSNGNTTITKFIINMLSGMLGKSRHKHSNCFINSDLEQIFSYFEEVSADNKKVFVEKLPNTDYYMYGTHTETFMNENNIPMYLQIVADNNIRLYDMMKAVGGELVARKVDCCIVRNPNPIVESKEWGGYRYCPVPAIEIVEKFNVIDMKINKEWGEYYIKDSSDWKKIYKKLEIYGGLLLMGDAGKGKTYVAKQIAKEIGTGVKIIAPTNKAALNIGGSTIHSFLKMDKNGKLHPKLIKIIKKSITHIIIDEISMIGKELWKRLTLLKQECPYIKFLLLGDDKQIPPVEDEEYDDYFNHPAVKFLTNNKRNILKVLKRYDENLYNMLCDVDNIETCKYPSTINRVNLCFLNSTRKAVNKYWNEKEKTKDSLFIPGDIYNEYSQDMYIYNELPVICYKTRRGDDGIIYANSEAFVVSNIDKENIYLWNERPNSEGEAEIYSVDIPIKEFGDYFLLNYCSTTHKAQGSTITDDFTIYDWKFMDTKLRYTALSRAKKVEQVSFGEDIKPEPNHTFKKNIKKKIEGHITYDKSKGYDTDIDCNYIMKLHQKQNGMCAMCNVEMKTQNYYKLDRQQFSIDRINSKQGHIKGNTQLLCLGCNCCKQDRDY